MSILRPTRRAALLGLAGAPFALTAARAQSTPPLDVPYVPTPQEVVDRMLAMARITDKDFVMDLGCGDGRMLVTAAKAGARGRGVDLNPQRIKEATANAAAAKVSDRVTFEVKNLFETSIKDANVLTMYLLPNVNIQLRPRILEEMAPGSRIVSHAFHMGEWEADQRADVGGRQIYFWVVPAKAAGTWTIVDGGDTLAVTLTQAFQKVEGATKDGARATGRLNGAELQLTVEQGGNQGGKSRAYAGRIDGDRMTPLEGARGGWTATRG